MKILLKRLILLLIGGAVPRVNGYLLLMATTKKHGFPLLAKLISNRLQRKYGIFISEKAIIAENLELKHPTGVVIGEGVKIGRNVKIFQNVTLGGARMGDWKEKNYPEVGENTVIFAGAVIVGKIKIGKNSVIGANSVVNKDVPDNTTVAGVPAKVIHQKKHQTHCTRIQYDK